MIKSINKIKSKRDKANIAFDEKSLDTKQLTIFDYA